MAASSKFVQVHPQILLEYIYTDQVSPETHSTLTEGIEILNNSYTGTNYLFSPDNTYLSNYRDRSVTPINKNRSEYAFLNKDIPLKYNDYDTNLTSTTSLPQTFSPNLDIKYDTIKYHFQSGFDFDGFDAIIFEIRLERRDGKFDNLSSIIYRKPDSFVTLNPNPFLIGERLYTSYLELKIPAFYYLNLELTSAPSNSNLLGYKLTSGKGFIKTSTIDVKLLGVYLTEKRNGFTFFKVREIGSVNLTQKDNFDLLVARLKESDNGDFFEFYGENAGNIFEDFMSELNNQPDNDYIAFHDIIVKEQIETNFIETHRETRIQVSDFGEANNFRPIIKNSAYAVSYLIEYTLRLINKVDNTQIIKKSQLILNNPKKYGRYLPKLDIGSVPTVTKVYNMIQNDNGGNLVLSNFNQIQNDNTNSVIKTEFVNVYRDRINIKVTSTPIKIQDLKVNGKQQS